MNIDASGRTQSVEIAARLRDDIIGGVFAFGSRLTLSHLEDLYRSGQMPIREALRQLQGEGLVELSPNRGARVRDVDIDFVRNLFDVRVAIEAMLTRRAAERIRKSDIAELEEAASAYERAAAARGVAPVLAANRAFHGIINRVAGNGEATEILKRNEQLVMALWLRHGYELDRSSSAAADHRQIIAALKAGDSDTAACVAMAHAAKAKLDLVGKVAAASASPRDSGAP